MKKTLLGAAALLALGIGLVLAMPADAADVKESAAVNYSQPVGGRTANNQARPIRVNDAGVQEVNGTVTAQGPDAGPVPTDRQGPDWDSDFSGHPTTCTSTGTNATVAIAIGGYWQGQCTAAAYVGTVANADAGPVGAISTCASLDGGSIPACKLRQANEIFYLDLTQGTSATKTTVACLSVSGTANCVLSPAMGL